MKFHFQVQIQHSGRWSTWLNSVFLAYRQVFVNGYAKFLLERILIGGLTIGDWIISAIDYAPME